MERLTLGNVAEESRVNFNVTSEDIPQSQREREYELQQRAGVSPSANFKGIRAQLAQRQVADELDILYRASESAMLEGAEPANVTEAVQNYALKASVDDEDISLEREAAINSIAEAYNEDEQTAINAANSAFTEDQLDALAKAEIIESWRQKNIEKAENSRDWKRFGKMLSNPLEYKPEAGDLDTLAYAGETAIRTLIPALGANILDSNVFPFGKESAVELSSDTIRNRQKKYIWDYANSHSQQELKQFLDQVDEYMWKKSWAGPATINAFMQEFNTNPNTLNDFFGGFEVATPVIRAVNNSIRAAKAAGKVTQAKTGIITAVKEGDRAAVVEEYVLPNALKPFQGSMTTSYSKKIEAEVADVLADREVMEIINKTRAAGVMDDEELFVNRELFKENFKALYGKELNDLADVNAIDLVQGPSGETLVAVDIGTGMDGSHAMDEAAAYFKAKKLGLPEGSFTVVHTDGEGFFIRYMQPLKDEDFTPIEGAIKDFKAKGFTRMFAGAGVSTSKRFQERVVEAARKEVVLRAKLDEKYGKSLRALNKYEADSLDALFVKGHQANEGKGTWKTPDQLEDMGVSEKVKKAYYDLKHLSDADYIINNDKLVRTLTREGYQLYGDNIIGKRINIDDITEDVYDTMKIKDLDTTKMPFEDFKNLAKDKVIVKGLSISSTKDNFNYVLISPEELKEGPLPRFLLPYQGGGRRAYTFGNMYVQNGRTFYGNKNIYNGPAKTLRAGTNRKALQQYVDEGNRAIRIYRAAKEDGDIATAARRIAQAQFKYFNIETWEDLDNIMKTFIDPSHDLQLLEEGGKYVYNNTLKSIDQAGVSSTDALYELARARDRYFNERGALLDSLNGDHAPIKSVFEIYDKTLAKAAYTNTIGEAEQWMAKEFDRNFRQFIDTRYWDNTGKTSLDTLRDAPLMKIDEAPEGMRDGIRAAMRFRDRYNIFAMAETPADKYIKHVLTWTARGLSNAGEKINIPRDAKVWQKLADTRPDQFMTGIGFHFAMGIYNTAQFMKQSFGVLTKLAIHPVQGSHALLASPFVSMAYAFKDSNKFMKETANVLNRLIGISRKDLDRFFEYCDWYGSFKVQDLRPGMSREHTDMLRRARFITKNSTMFANAGNKIDYFVSDLTSFLSNPKASFAEIAQHSDDLYINMSRFDISKMQASAGVLQQWLTYPARMTEAIFNTRLTKAQRIRLATSQLALWGVGGTLGAEVGLNAYRFFTENTDIPEEVANDISNGLLTNLARAHGYDLQEGLGLLDTIDTYFNIFNADKGLLELNMPGLKTGEQLASIYNAVKEVFAPATDVPSLNTWLVNRASDRSAPASLRNISNAVLGAKTGQMYDSNRQLIRDNVSTQDIVMRLIGFKDINEERVHLNKYVLRDYREEISEAAKSLKPFMDQLVDYRSMGKYEDSAAMTDDYWKVWENYKKAFGEAKSKITYNHLEYQNAVDFDLTQAVEKFYRLPTTTAEVSEKNMQDVTGLRKVIRDYLLMKEGQK